MNTSKKLGTLIYSFRPDSWAVHNLVGHPMMQILTWLGKPELGVRVHDVTIPRPDLYAPRSDE